MFPTFVQSFGDQLFAVAINLIGTVLGGIATSVFNAISTGFLLPLIKSISQSLGLPT